MVIPPLPSSPTSVVQFNEIEEMPEEVNKKKRVQKRRPMLSKEDTRKSFRYPLRELSFQKRHYFFASNSWRLALALMAFADVSETILQQLFLPKEDASSTVSSGRNKDQFEEAPHDYLQWLSRWRIQIGIVFCILWYIDASSKAKWLRDERLIELDRKRIMMKSSVKHLAAQDENEEKSSGGAWTAYYWTVGLQLLLLPVGFYLFLWNSLRNIAYPMNVQSSQVGSVSSNDEMYQWFVTHSVHSLLFSPLPFYTMVTNRFVKQKVEAQYKLLYRRLVRFALRHPFIFSYRLRIFFRSMRLAKYLAPLMGLSAKLFDNTIDLVIKLKQHYAVKKASRFRKKVWAELSPEELRVAAAIRIQSVFRGVQTRKVVKALIMIRETRKSFVVRRMQRAFRKSLVRARTRIHLKKLELDSLQEEAIKAKYSRVQMCVDDRRRMYELQNELTVTASDLVSKKLLLRPNTRFAVVWKVVFVMCVILDISWQAWTPYLDKKHMNKDTGESLDIDVIIENHVVPAPMSEWADCSAWLLDPAYHAKQVHSSPIVKKRTKKKQTNVEGRPWYCRESVAAVHSLFVSGIRFLLLEGIVVIGIICYLDVFVTFFIGELHPKTGVLTPKSFFKRWLFPGLLLELVANPYMETTSMYIVRLLDGVVNIGPIRVWRWTVVLFYPLLKMSLQALEVHVLQPVVREQNQEIQQRQSVQNQRMMLVEQEPEIATRRRSSARRGSSIALARERSVYGQFVEFG